MLLSRFASEKNIYSLHMLCEMCTTDWHRIWHLKDEDDRRRGTKIYCEPYENETIIIILTSMLLKTTLSTTPTKLNIFNSSSSSNKRNENEWQQQQQKNWASKIVHRANEHDRHTQHQHFFFLLDTNFLLFFFSVVQKHFESEWATQMPHEHLSIPRFQFGFYFDRCACVCLCLFLLYNLVAVLSISSCDMLKKNLIWPSVCVDFVSDNMVPS